MKVAEWPRQVLLLTEDGDGGDFGTFLQDALEAHGCEVRRRDRRRDWEEERFDLALTYGPFTFEKGSLVPSVRRLLARPEGQRPFFVWWLTENEPSRHLPDRLIGPLASLRFAADRVLERMPPWLPRSLRRQLLRGHRLRVVSELEWARRQGVLDLLVTTGESRAAFYRRRGFAPSIAPLGYHPLYGRDQGAARDIDVAFIGNAEAPRRRRMLRRLERDLDARGIALKLVDGVYGSDRSELLNRCRIVVNLLRAPQDFVGQRFVIVAANKAMLVSEPVASLAPFVEGRHLAVAPLERMADTISHYLLHESERQRIASEAHRFVTEELTMEQSVGRVLEAARGIRGARLSQGADL